MKTKFDLMIVSSLIFCIAFTSCKKEPGEEIKDVTAPQVIILFPSNGSTISQSITIAADATDNSGVIRKVEIFIDGALAISDTIAPYNYFWDISFCSEVQHTIFCKAYDNSNNIGQSDLFTIFTTAGNFSGPVLIDPLMDQFKDSDQIAFQWEQYANSTKYILQISKDTTFLNNIQDVETEKTEQEIKISITGRFFWRVCAVNSQGKRSKWSTVRSFIIPQTVPPILYNTSIAYRIKTNNGIDFYVPIEEKDDSHVSKIKLYHFLPSGSATWNTELGILQPGQEQYGRFFDISPSGDIVFATERYYTSDSTACQVFKLHQNGYVTWNKTYKIFNTNKPWVVKFIGDDDVLVSGTCRLDQSNIDSDRNRNWEMLLDVRGNIIWNRVFIADSINNKRSAAPSFVHEIGNNNLLQISQNYSDTYSLYHYVHWIDMSDGKLLRLKRINNTYLANIEYDSNSGYISMDLNKGIVFFNEEGEILSRGDYVMLDGFVNISKTSTGGYLFCSDSIVYSVNEKGRTLWTKSLAGTIHGFAETNNGDYIGVGQLFGKAWIFSLSSDGSILW